MHLKLCHIRQQHMNFTQFFIEINSENNSNDNQHTQLVQTKFNIGTPHLDNHCQSFLTAD